MLSLMELPNTNTKHLWLEISPTEQETAWHDAQRHSNPIACYNAYLNCMCLRAFLGWLVDWLSEDSELHPEVLPTQESLPSIWEVVNGSAITVGETRLVLVPTETSYLSELCVPQEWVDISSWAADYYLAMQVNLDLDDDCWIKVCGFATHRQLKYKGRYNQSDRTYSLPIEQLTENLTLLFATLGLCLQEEVPSEEISSTVIQNLLLTLGDASVYSPRLRLDVPFSQWAALISHEKSRQQLYNQRLGLSDISVAVAPKTPVNLSQWFDKLFAAGWQPLNEVFNPQLGNLAFSLRNDALKIAVNGIKIIDLGMQLGGESVALLLAVSQEPEEKIGILVQVHPAGNQKYLPRNLSLLLIKSGKTLQEVKSRSQDYYIQLSRFKGSPGASFSIQLILGDCNITEDFCI